MPSATLSHKRLERSTSAQQLGLPAKRQERDQQNPPSLAEPLLPLRPQESK